MAKVSAGDIRNGITIEVNGKVCQVIDFMHVKPGKGAAFVRVNALPDGCASENAG